MPGPDGTRCNALVGACDVSPLDQEQTVRVRGRDRAELTLNLTLSAVVDPVNGARGRLTAVSCDPANRPHDGMNLPNLFEDSPHGILLVDRTGRIADANRAASELFGCPTTKLVGTPLLELVQPPKSRIQQVIRRGLSAGNCFRERVHLIREDDQSVTADLAIVPAANGKSQGGIACYLYDATERVAADKRRTARLRLEQKARAAAEAAQRRAGKLALLAGELTFSLDYDQTLRKIAELAVQGLASYCVLYLRQDENTIRIGAKAFAEPGGPRFQETTSAETMLVPPGSVTATTLDTGHPLLLNGPEVQIDEILGLNEEHRRRLRELELSSAMLLPLTARGTVHGVIAFFKRGEDRANFDEEDLRFAESLAQSAAFAIDNAQLYRTAQRAVAAREELLAIVAHDLRSPLGAISVSAETLKEFSLEESGRQYHLEIIQRASGRMSRQIQDLLDVANIELGQLTCDRSRQPVLPILEETHGLFAAHARAKRLEFNYGATPETATIWADRYRLLQVLSNLLENAIKFSPAGGSVGLHAQQGPEGIEFVVSDTGRGIPAENIPHVFDRFWRAKEIDDAGTGLGLAIAKGIVAAHGGRIWAESTIGEGTRFHFILPARGDELSTPARERKRPRFVPSRPGSISDLM